MPNTINPLEAAAAEIQATLRRYDIAALVTMVVPAGVMTVHHINPSWSCARLEKAPDGRQCICVSSRPEDFATPALQHLCVEKTMGMLLTFEHQAQQDLETMRGIVQAVSEQTGMRIDFRVERQG